MSDVPQLMDQAEDVCTVNLNCEFRRLKTYPKIWSFNNFNKGDLASNGFFYVSPNVKCFSCNITIEPLKPVADQDLTALHITLSPDCACAHRRDPNNLPIPATLHYNWELHRVITFLRTSWEAPADLFDLAKWGFYYTGQGDVGRCFICRLEVRGWERDDKGESEHRKWNPNCPFIQNREVGNVALGEENALTTTSGIDVAPVLQLGTVRLEDMGNLIDLTQARHSQYTQREDRMATYSMWPMSIAQRPEQLADAGFYYTGRGDRVVCFYCGGGLKDWGDGDSPWVEHAAWFSHCEFVKVIKGAAFINQSQVLRSARSASEVQQFNQSSVNAAAISHEPQPESQAVVAQCPTESPELETGGVAVSASINADLDESSMQLRMCKVCFIKELGIVFLPCGHMATCPDCAPQLTNCPICRTKANAYVRAYLP